MHFLGRTKRTPSYRHSHSHHYPSYAGCPSVPGQPLSRDFFFFKVSRLMGHLTYPLCAIVTFFIYHVRKPYQKGSETSGVIILEPAEAWPRARRTGRPHPMQPLRRRRRRRRRRWMPDPPTRLAVKPLQRQLSSTRGALTRGSHRLVCSARTLSDDPLPTVFFLKTHKPIPPTSPFTHWGGDARHLWCLPPRATSTLKAKRSRKPCFPGL